MPESEIKNWFYATSESEKAGPVGFSDLADLARSGVINPETLVWNPEQTSWIPAEKIAHLFPKKPQIQPVAPETAEHPEVPARDLKPRKSSFIFPRVASHIVLWIFLSFLAAGALGFFEIPPWFVLPVLACSIFFTLFSAFVAYRKERYEHLAKRLICHWGGLFSDQTTELEIRNITQVKLKLPWLRYKFFKVGDVIVESAGSAKPMIMHSIHDPEMIYAEIGKRMKRNGYDLSQRELLHQERPALIGVIGETIGRIITITFFFLFFSGGFLKNPELFEGIMAQAGLAILALAVLGSITLRFLDLRRRTYRVYNDVVTYDEGFLTRHNAFIPYENIADSNTKQSFFDQLFGLFDVIISCQGSNSNIKFRRLKGGAVLADSIDRLVELANRKPKPAPSNTSSENPRKPCPRREEPDLTPLASIPVAEFRMHGARVLIPLLLLLPLFPLWVVAMVKSLILLTSTRYFVRASSLRHSFRFLTVHEREFSFDKITGLIIKTNLWDKMFGTVTLKFWSIGSARSLEFAHVHRSQLNLPALMQQIGIPAASAEPHSPATNFSFSTWLRAHIYCIPLMLLLIAGIIVLASETDQLFLYLLAVPVIFSLAVFVYEKIYYSTQRLFFHDHHLEAQQGIIAIRHYLVRYRNVKRTRTTEFPFGKTGNLTVFVAGEEELLPNVKERKGQKPLLKQCTFRPGFLAEVSKTGLFLNDILCGKVDPSSAPKPTEVCAPIAESKRSTGNAISILLLISLLIFPLLVLLPLTIPLTIIRIKRWHYSITESAIAMRWGLFFRKQETVILDRVDSLAQSQGPLNKMFRNGNVSIMTAGSSKADLVITDSPAYLALHQAIRDRTQ